jgi:hypothetical protein
MSAPVRDEQASDDPLLYAPRWARRPLPSTSGSYPAEARLASAQPLSTARSSAPATGQHNAEKLRSECPDAPPMAPGVGGPNIDLPPSRLRPFEGDVAIKELRRRLAFEPEVIPEPLRAPQRDSALSWFGRFLLILIMAAVVTFCATLLILPLEQWQPQFASAPSVAAPRVATPSEDTPQTASPAEPTRLIVENQRAFANDPLPLGVSINDSSGGETITLVGLAGGTKLTAGMPLGLTGWQMSARDLGNVYAYAPKDFVGIMDTAIDLRSARDRLVDSQIVRLEWLPRTQPRLTQPSPKLAPAAPVLDAEEIAVLVKRGEEFLKTGDIAAARLLLRRAAAAGNAQAAFDLAITFDQPYLAQQGVLGFAPDLAQARAWYEKAAELGSQEASQRLEQLANRGM